MNLAKHDAETEMDMDMTPMIDVVFLLIIFFMVITDLTQQELEDVQLPVSETASPDKPDPDEWRPILNINHRGEIIYKRETYLDPEIHRGANKFRDLRPLLLQFAEKMKLKQQREGKDATIPNEPLLIRADMSTSFKYIQWAMEQSAQPDVMIWKLEMAVSTPEEKE